MRILTALLASLVLHSVVFDTVAAQGQIEVGFDGGVLIDGDGTDAEVLTIALPLESIRMGLHLGRRFSAELLVGGSRIEVLEEPSTTLTDLSATVVGLYHFGDGVEDVRFHVLGGIPFRYRRIADPGEDFSDSDVGIAFGAGVTLPFAAEWAMRLQSRAIGWSGSQTQLAFLLGLSLFLE